MSKKKPTPKKRCNKSCKKKNCEVKKDAQARCNNSLPELSSTTIVIKRPSRLRIFWNYIKQKLGL